MKAVIMAGGFGTRIQPLTNSLPKPMLPIINKPMMEHVIVKLRDELQIDEFVILLYFKPETIKDYFEDGSKWGIKISYVLPDDDYGTAGALKCAQEYLENDNFIIVSGDLVTDFDFNKLLMSHKDKNAKFSIGLTSVEDPLQFGVVITNKEGKIEKFLEKPSWGEVFSDTINTGIYLIEPEILDYIPKNQNFDFAQDLFPLLMKNEVTLWGATLEGYWRDVGNPKSYRDVHKDIMEGLVSSKFDNISFLGSSNTILSKDNKSFEHVYVTGRVILGKNVTIGKNVRLENVVIGDNVTIGDYTSIENSVLWSNIKLGENSYIQNSIICDRNRIENNVRVKKGLTLAENCHVLMGASFEKDVTVWPDKVIDEHSIISNNIVWGSKHKNSIFEEGLVRGRTNIEISCEMVTKLAEALGSKLPLGSSVYISRDYHSSSQMLKRSFVGGILSSGVNVLDIETMPSSAMRFHLANNKRIVAGVHFRQSIKDKTHTEVLIFSEDGLRIDTNMAKNIERVFFREDFRRVGVEKIGKIREIKFVEETYKNHMFSNLDIDTLQNSNIKIAVDMMHGSSATLYPDIINSLHLDNIILNANFDEEKLENLHSMTKIAKRNLSKLVKSLNYDAGVMIYPNGQKLRLIANDGTIIPYEKALLSVLFIINQEAKEKRKVYLPAWAPDLYDDLFTNLEIEKGKYSNFTAEQLKEYYLVASVDGNFAFIDFALNRDAMFASLKIIQKLIKQKLKLSNIISKFDNLAYIEEQVPCENALKGMMMRKFLEDSETKQLSMKDGIKIWLDKNSWILMIPDQYSDYLNLYIQSDSKDKAQDILDSYKNKIINWIDSKNVDQLLVEHV